MNTKRSLFIERSIFNFVLIIVLLFGQVGQVLATPAILHVKADATGVNNGTSWADAYTDLQSAISAATNGDQIWVAAGTYYPTSGPDRTATFTLQNDVAIYGGFTGTETLLVERDPSVNVTILSGDIGILDDTSDNSYHVITGGGTNNTAVLDGFSVTAGNANGTTNPNFRGGGMYNNNSSPSLRNMAFSGNSASNSGGGMYNDSSNPVLTNVIFSSNTSAREGGGMGNENSGPSLTNVAFITNTASNYGGGMFNAGSAIPMLMNVTFRGNTAAIFGGGMYNLVNNASLTNVTFSDNTATEGGGMFNDDGSPSLTNVTFSGNIATGNAGGAIWNYSGDSDPIIKNSIFWGNSTEFDTADGNPVISDSIVAGGCPAGGVCTNVIDADPLLDALADNGGFTQTMSLGAGSPAIDAGDNASCATTDQRGVARPQGPHCDMGAYEAPDTFAPSVSSIHRTNPDPTTAASVDFTVTFSEPVQASSVDAGDFTLTTSSGISGAAVSGVNGSGATYTVSVNTGSGLGTIRLDVVDDDSIVDTASNPIGGAGAGNGNFTGGEFYTIAATITSCVSVDSSGGQGNNSSAFPSISADGRYVAFYSNASNLVSGDTNGATDIFVRDTVANTTVRISLDSSGGQANSNSYVPSISADGRYVAFESIASNLVSGDTNGASDVFVRDTVTNTTVRVSLDSSGGQGNSHSLHPSISADGRYVVFTSYASSLVSGDTNVVSDVFVHDMVTNTTVRVSVDSSGGQGNNSSVVPSISADGRYVAFYSEASNLVSGDTNAVFDVFVHDMVTNTTMRVSVDSSGGQGNSNSYVPSISADGRYVAFESIASNLVSGDTNGTYDVFRRDTVMNTTVRVSLNSSGGQGNSHSLHPSISADGRYVAFYSYASNLVSGDTNVVFDVFVHSSRQAMDTLPPAVVSIVRANPNPTTTASVNFTVTFSETVIATNVDASDFVVTTTGITGAAISGVSGSGATYTISVGTGTGSGEIRLDVVDDDSIVDTSSNPLGGTGTGNGDFTNGEFYTKTTTIIVNANSDTVANNGLCTLREAIINANADNQSGSTDCSSGFETDVITFAGDYTITLTSQLPTIISTMTISGNGVARTILQANASPNTATYRVLEVGSLGNNVILNNLTIRNGRCNGSCANVIYQSTGGGILNSGYLTLNNVMVSGNSATLGGGIFNNGAILFLNSSTISNNSSGERGGGIFDNGMITLNNSTVSGNSAGTHGGGIYHLSNLILNYTTVANNTSDSNNDSIGSGGGVYNGGGGLSRLWSSIVAGNKKGASGITDSNADCFGTITSQNYNLFGNGTGCSFTSFDVTVTPSSVFTTVLRPLADYGGPTQTHALPASSPARDRIANGINVCGSAPFNLDQRGVIRPKGTHCDTGAYEYESFPVLYAQPGGLIGGTCNTWANACELRYALSIADSGQQIWVQEGIHKPTGGSDRTATFTLKNGVAIYGGFDGTETLLSDRDHVNNFTTLSGDLSGNDGANFANYGENSYHVVTGGGTNNTAILDGFTVTAGNANGGSFPHYLGGGMVNYNGSPILANMIFSDNTASYGGGMLNDNGSPTLTNVTFSGNTASISGGGMSNYNSSNPTIMNATFSANSASAHDAGGMRNENSSPILMNVTFSNNTSNSAAGGILNINSNPTLTNVTFSDNSAFYGGGMYNSSSNPVLSNVTFSGHIAGIGGGMYNYVSSPSLTNVTVSGNSAGGGGGGMYNENSSNPIIKNSIFWGNNTQIVNIGSTPSVSDSTVQGGYPGGTNIINADPLLGALANNGGLTLTMAISIDSPAIDAGNTATCATSDQRGVARPFGANCDMGAFELEYIPPSIRYVANTGTDVGICGNSANPCRSITYAISRAVAGNTIEIAAGTYTEAGITVDKDLTLTGAGASSTFVQAATSPGATTNRVFHINDGVTATIENMTIQNGFLGISNEAGTLTLNNSTVSGNSHPELGGIINGINGILTLNNSTVSGNSSGNAGGGIFNDGGTVMLNNSTVSDNSARVGGGLYTDGGTITISNSTFSGNTSISGGGVYNNGGTLIITNSTFSGNNSSGDGAGIHNLGGYPMSITNSSFSGNNAAGNGGGLFNRAYAVGIVTNSTFSNNSAGFGGGIYNSEVELTLNNTIIANSTGGDCVNDIGVVTGSNNLIEDPSSACELINNTNGNIIGIDPALGILTGSPAYFPLNNGSPAIDAGNNATCATTDQRGVTRPQGPHCDIGAYESQFINSAPVIAEGITINITMSEDGSPTSFDLTLHATDVDGNTLTWSISTPASNGTATAIGTGLSTIIGYSPSADYHGSDSFDVQVSDGNGGLDTITVNVTVRPVLTVTTAPKTITYGAAEPSFTFTYSGFVGGDDQGDIDTPPTCSVTGAHVNVNSYPIICSGGSDNIYDFSYVSNDLTITPKPITVSADVQSKVYGSADPAFTYQVTSGALESGDNFTGTLTRAIGENVGAYAITQGTLTAGSNYDLTYVGANLTITSKPITITADPQSKVYRNVDPALTYQVTNGALVGSDSFTGALTRVVGENVGTYAIAQGTLSTGSNYNLMFVGADLVITKKVLTVTADPQTKVYGELDPSFRFTYSGFVSGDNSALIDTTPNCSVPEVHVNVGRYRIICSGGADNNYSFQYFDNELEITARPITVAPYANGKVYGTADPTLTYEITSGMLVSGDSFTGALTREPGENVGFYVITQGTLSAGSNYNLTTVDGDFLIEAKPITVTADPQSKIYGGSDPSLSYSFTPALVSGDSFTGSLTREAGEDVGTYAIQQGTLALSGNYTLAYIGDDLNITEKPITVTADPKSKVYGTADPAFTYQITSGTLESGDSFSGSLTREPGENVGTYEILLGTLTAGNNYDLTFISADLAITLPTDLIFMDGLESGDLSAWSSSQTDGGDLSVTSTAALIESFGMQAVIDNNTAIYVTDNTPNAEPRYRARFYFDPNSIAMGNNNVHYIFYGNNGANQVLRIEFQCTGGACPASGLYQLRAEVRHDNNTWTPSAWITISNAPHFIEVDWRASTAVGANNGGLTFWIDGTQQANFTNIDNDTRRIDSVQVGAVAGIDTATRGTYYFDDFESRTQTYIGGNPNLPPPPPLPDLIFANGFETGNLSAWSASVADGTDLSVTTAAALNGSFGMQALIDNNPGIYLTDNSPNAEARYHVRFYFDPNSIAMNNGNAHYIFYGYSGTTQILRIEFRRSAGAYQLRTAIRNDGSGWTNSNWFTISDSSHAIELDWRASTAAGAINGGLTFWIDGVQQANLTGVDNDTRRIDSIELGAVSGIDTATRGTYYFDAFESRRQTYIGP